MIKKETHGLTLTHKTIINFLAMWTFLIGTFLVL